ncbi:hypothetical protein BCL57_003046 [Agromyces flavus]|nr:hypothetical protein [Agromyces flavus]MCP2368867.1 hypothetical protein [Agromyces flavus]
MPRFRRPQSPATSASTAAGDPASGGAGIETVLAGYRLIRRLATGERADVYLATAHVDPAATPPIGATSSGSLVVVRVYGPAADEEAIANEMLAMEHDGSGATPALLDVAGLAEGRCCLVVERIAGMSLAAVLADGGLLPGQAVTALAPIVVAVRELAGRGLVHTRLDLVDVTIDADGRPRLLGLGALARLDRAAAAGVRADLLRTGHAALLRLIGDVAAATRDRRAFDGVIRIARDALEARPFVPRELELEQALFDVAAPLPLPGRPSEATLRREVPSRVVGVAAPSTAPGPAQTRAAETDADDLADARAGRPGRWARLAAIAQLPTGAAAEMAEALDHDPRAALTGRLGDVVRRRRGALLTGGFVGAGALVVLLTAVPPSAADPSSRPRDESAASIAPSHEPESPPPSPEPDGGGSDAEQAAVATDPGAAEPDADDAITAAAALLEIRTSCLASRDLACLDAVVQPGSPIEARDRAAIERGDTSAEAQADLDAIRVVADLGDAVVVSVPDVAGEREPASLLIMRSEAGWRLREWFD